MVLATSSLGITAKRDLAQARRAKALELLQSGWPPHAAEPAYECDTALVLCRVAAFSPGLVFLLDRRRLHREVLQVTHGLL